MRARHYYTSEEDAWLRENVCRFKRYSDLVRAFNSTFRTDVDRASLQQRCSKFLKISLDSHHSYTEKEKQWLRDNIELFDRYIDLTNEFNRIFGTNIHRDSIQTLCVRCLDISIGKSCTCYKLGDRSRALSIGTVRRSSTGTYIKVADGTIGITGYSEPDWLPLQKKIWQDNYGELGDDYMVCFLNHDRDDFRLENLYPITRKISAIMSKNKWWSDVPELTMAAIKWCELHYAIKDV